MPLGSKLPKTFLCVFKIVPYSFSFASRDVIENAMKRHVADMKYLYLVTIILGSGYTEWRKKRAESNIIVLTMYLEEYCRLFFDHNIDWKAQRVLANNVSSDLVAYFQTFGHVFLHNLVKIVKFGSSFGIDND